jgi:hypothetical protein
MPRASATSCRLYVIQARDGRSAVVFRRGPSRQVAVLRWWLATETVTLGQWFRGRIYERRCDLSPDGSLLVYFAAKHRGPFGTWTAVSRPPYLTALALWPKGDAWGGGGLFRSARRLGLNHPEHQLATAPGLAPPRSFHVERYAPYAGGGEDDPILHDRMIRDGWRLVAQGNPSTYRSSGPARWVLDEPEIYARPQPPTSTRQRSPPKAAHPLELRRELHAVGVTQGPWYREDFLIVDARGRCLRLFADCDWADWQSNGDLLAATGGKLYRLTAADAQTESADPLAGAHIVADLAPLVIETSAAPPEAGRWSLKDPDRRTGRPLVKP